MCGSFAKLLVEFLDNDHGLVELVTGPHSIVTQREATWGTPPCSDEAVLDGQ